jgi:hypothetical protein
MVDLRAIDYPASIRALALEADEAMSADIADAYGPVTRELAAIRAYEQEYGFRLHKGHALYNLGVIELGRQAFGARTYFLAAYVEDVRTWPRRGDRPPDAAAARVLSDLFGLKRHWFSVLSKVALRAPARDPVEVAGNFEETHDLPEFSLGLPPDGSRPETDLTSTPSERRVFLGGNYWKCPDRITNARVVIAEAGFAPIVVKEFEYLPGENERTKSFRLLDQCDLVVLEASEHGGWWPELERLANGRRHIPTFVQYVHPPSVMLPTTADMPNLEYSEYSSDPEMRYKLLRWLNRHLPTPSIVWVPSSAGPFAASSNTPIMPSGIALPGTATPDRD